MRLFEENCLSLFLLRGILSNHKVIQQKRIFLIMLLFIYQGKKNIKKENIQINMDHQQIWLGQNDYQIIDLNQQFDDLQISSLFQQNKQSLYLYVNSKLSDQQSNLFIQELKCLTQLIGLYLSLQNEIKSKSNSFLTKFGVNLHYFDNLKYLFIKTSATNIQLTEFGRNLSQLQKLEFLSLTIFDASYLGIEGYKSLRQGIFSLSSLNHLEFMLKFDNNSDDTKIQDVLLNCLSELNNLKCLSFNCTGYFNLREDGLDLISQHLKCLRNKNLQTLKLEFESIIQYDNFELLKEQYLNLFNLQEEKANNKRIMSNKYKKTNINNNKQSLCELLEDLIKLKSSTNMEICVQLKISKEKDVKSPIRLFFSLDSSHQKDEIIRTNYVKIDENNYEIKTNLLNLKDQIIIKKSKFDKKRKQTIVYFEKKQINFGLQFRQQLTELSISFENIKHLQQKFNKALNLTQLEKLDISLYFSNEMFIQNQINFKDWLKELTILKQLKVKQLDGSRENYFVEFTESFQYLKQLVKLDLELMYLRIIDVQPFCNSIQYLQNLQSFNLTQISEPHNELFFDEKQAIKILKILANFKHLNNLKLNLYMNQFQQNQFYSESSRILKILDNLRVIYLKNLNRKPPQIQSYSKLISSKNLRLVNIII